MRNNFQRVGASNNAHVGRDFENKVLAYFFSEGIELEKDIPIEIGIGKIKKAHSFDLGNTQQKIIVECKSHKWTSTDNVPSAKMTTWDQAMYYFLITPSNYRKIFMVLRDHSAKREETLCEYYVRLKPHLIPDDVEIWEFDEETNTAKRRK